MPDLASIDAHSAAMAMSQSDNVSDRIHGGVVKKSVRSLHHREADADRVQ